MAKKTKMTKAEKAILQKKEAIDLAIQKMEDTKEKLQRRKEKLVSQCPHPDKFVYANHDPYDRSERSLVCGLCGGVYAAHYWGCDGL